MLIFCVFFLLSVLSLALFIMAALRKKTEIHTIFTPYRIVMLGLFVSAFLFFVPYYVTFFYMEHFAELCAKTVLLAAHHAIRLFVVGAEYSEIYTYAIERGTVGAAYSLYGSLLYVASPLMTFGFILSFFRGITAKLRILFCGKKRVMLFSNLNGQSILLAHQIRQREPKALLIFTGVPLDEDDDNVLSELVMSAKRMDAILLKERIGKAELQLSRRILRVQCFILGDDEDMNILHAFELINNASKRAKIISVLCNQENYLFDDLPVPDHISLRRIEHVRSLVLRTLENYGTPLFRSAASDHHIGALVIGLGRYGTEMTKALSWLTQAEGYSTQIHCMDQDTFARDRFMHQCPGYFSPEADPSHCEILFRIQKFGTWDADQSMMQMQNIKYVFIALGDDDANICAAYEVRSLFARLGNYPMIHAVVQNMEKCRMLQGRKTPRGRDYDITFIGSPEELYSYDAIMHPDVDIQVINEHAKWDPNNREQILTKSAAYRSTRAQLMHRRIMEELGQSEELRPRSEHRRWIHYMYSEGYQPALPSSQYPDQKINDLAKTHTMLCPFDVLPDELKSYY